MCSVRSWGALTEAAILHSDLRGRATFGQDSGGSGRITSAGGNFDGTTIGNVGGVQNRNITTTYLPASAPTLNLDTVNLSVSVLTAFTTTLVGAGTDAPPFAHVNSITGPTTATVSPTGTISNLGSGTTFPVLSNAAIVNKCVRF